MEQGTCLIAVLYVALNVSALTHTTIVGHATALYCYNFRSLDIICHWTHNIWFPIGGPL